MSILFAGTEDSDFPINSGMTVQTFTYFRSTYGLREAVGLGSANGSYFASAPFSAQTSLWMQAMVYNNQNNVTNKGIFGVTSSSAFMKGIYLGPGSAYNKLAIFTFDGTTWTKLVEESGTSFTYTLRNQYTLQVSSYGVSGTVTAYVNGTQVATYTGDIRISGVSNFDTFIGYAPSANSICYFSEVIIADEDPRTFILALQNPSAAGDATAWTGAYTDINETTLSDVTMAYVNSNAADAQFNLLDAPAGNYGVKAVVLSARACKSASSTPTKLALGIKSNSTIDAGTGQALTTSWSTYQRILATNPTNSNANFTITELNALQLNLRSVA
jgi:hypothetical protein